ncbi:MAG: META domain-containing protein [Bacteroidetes bacterium]|nr:META domain-containing protein [Bacteroidota bacterium]
MKKLALIFAILFVVVSCTTNNTIGSTKKSKAQPSLYSTQWTLAEVVKGKNPTMVLENGKISGNAGCNNYFGSFEMDTTQGSLKINNLGTTRMACPNMSAESNFLKILGETNRYIVNGEHLELYKDNLLLLKMIKLSK